MSINSTWQRMHRFMIVVCLFSLASGSFVATQTSAKAQEASPTPIHVGDSWKGTATVIDGTSSPMTFKIASVSPNQYGYAITGSDSRSTSYVGGEGTFAQVGVWMQDAIARWGHSPIDRYMYWDIPHTFTMYSAVEEKNGELLGTVSSMGFGVTDEFSLTKNIPASPQRNKLVVVVQGLDSLLKAGNVAGNNGYGSVSGFGTIVANLQKTAEFKTNTQFMAFSYKGSQNKTDGKPLVYGCEDTYANPIMLDESNLKAQISLYLTKRPNTDVYLFSHSLGGVVTFAYVADLVENNRHSLSLGGGSVLKGVAIADSPLGGVISDSRYLKRVIEKSLLCNKLPTDMFSIADLVRIQAQIPSKTFFEGLTASIYYSILNNGKGTYITNQQVGQDAVNLGLRLVIVGNEYDLLWHPNVCGEGTNFGNTEYMVETGKGITNGGALYVRSFKNGSLNCFDVILHGANHFYVLSNSDVEPLVLEVFTDRTVDKLTPVTVSHKA